LANPAHPLGGALEERAEVLGFGELDERVRTLGSHGVLVARVTSEDDAKSLAQHLVRRAKFAGRRAVRASLCVESTWRDAALRLGVSPLPSDAVEAARTLAARASALNALVVAGISRASTWDVEVAKAIEEHADNALFVITVIGDALPGALSFTIPSELGSDGLARWWEAALAAHSEQHGGRLSKLFPPSFLPMRLRFGAGSPSSVARGPFPCFRSWARRVVSASSNSTVWSKFAISW
jgi:hypothetical protein